MATMRISLLVSLLASTLCIQGLCYQLPETGRNVNVERRDVFRSLVASSVTATAAAATAVSVIGNPEAANAATATGVLSSKYCASGVGEGCGDLSEGNELIRSLQEKSAANKEKNAQQARDAYYMKNYPDFFATLGKTLVKKPDGSFMVVSDAQLEKLKRDNMLTVEIPRAMGGQVTDLTQKPILVLKE